MYKSMYSKNFQFFVFSWWRMSNCLWGGPLISMTVKAAENKYIFSLQKLIFLVLIVCSFNCSAKIHRFD